MAPLVRRILTEVGRLERLPYPRTPDGGEDEAAFAARRAEVGRKLLHLAHTPCRGTADAAARLTLVCARLREEVGPDDQVRLTTYLLAESVRDALLAVGPDPA